MRLLLPSILLAAAGLSPVSPDEVRVIRISGEEVLPRSIGIDGAGMATLDLEAGPLAIPIRDLRSIAFLKEEASPAPGPALFLAGGGRLAGEITAADGQSLRFKSAAIQEASFPLSGVRAFRLSRADLDDEKYRAQMEKEKRGDSIFVIREGELFRVPGTFRSLDSDSLSVVWEGQEQTLAREKVYGVVLSGGAPGEGARTCTVALADGGRLQGEILGLDEGRLALKVPLGVELAIDRGALLRVEILSDRLVFLSDLEPVKVDEVPYFNTLWPHRKDRSLDGKPIRLRGKTFGKGLGVHSRCTLTYALGGAYESFSAVIGIDDETKGLGHVVFRVRADGETLFDSGGVGGKDEPRRIKIDVGGRQELVLDVDFGDDLDIGDHADWADAHLVRKS